jgi:hypothetical protein
LRVEVWRVEGVEKWSGLPISMICAANRQTRAYLLGLLVNESFRETFLGKKWLWSAASIVSKAPDCSLIVLATQKRIVKYLHLQSSFFVPAWVEMEVDLPPCPTRPGSIKSLKSDLNRLRKHDLRYEVTAGSDAIEDFYANFYRPYITRVHGPRAVMVSRGAMRAKAPQCELLRVTRQGSIIAAALIVRDRPEPRLWCIGIRDGSSQYIEQGACFATYHFSFEYLAKQGFRKVGLGWSRAFLRDGVLRYKSKWSPRITRATQDGFVFKFTSCSKAAQSFLLNNPFIFEQSGTLSGALFVSSTTQSSEEPRPCEDFYLLEGTSNLIRYVVPGPGAAAIYEVSSEGCNDRGASGS